MHYIQFENGQLLELDTSERSHGGKLCHVCNLVVQVAEHIIGTTMPHGIDAIKLLRDLDNVCTMLPPDYTEQCHTFVKDDLAVVVQALADGQSSQEVCASAVHVCG